MVERSTVNIPIKTVINTATAETLQMPMVALNIEISDRINSIPVE